MPFTIPASWLFAPFALQSLCMAVDELYFHRQRALPPWERWGHPLDTLTVLACFGWLYWLPPSTFSASMYAALSLFSCFFVTKDEAVHHHHCSPGEHWVHALMFMLHPLILLSAGLLWPVWHGQTLALLTYSGFERMFLLGNVLLTFGFGLYQLLYWNLLWPSRQINQIKQAKQAKSTTTSTTP
jgi:hypothetical protein